MLTIQEIRSLAAQKILVLDGAMGTMLQAGHPTAADFNGGEFASHPVPLTGDNDVLNITRPDLVKSVHRAYLEAGAAEGTEAEPAQAADTPPGSC